MKPRSIDDIDIYYLSVSFSKMMTIITRHDVAHPTNISQRFEKERQNKTKQNKTKGTNKQTRQKQKQTKHQKHN